MALADCVVSAEFDLQLATRYLITLAWEREGEEEEEEGGGGRG